jgi:hypothetical protein
MAYLLYHINLFLYIPALWAHMQQPLVVSNLLMKCRAMLSQNLRAPPPPPLLTCEQTVLF